MTAASVSAGTDVLRRHCDLDDLSRTAVGSKSNRSCNHRITREPREREREREREQSRAEQSRETGTVTETRLPVHYNVITVTTCRQGVCLRIGSLSSLSALLDERRPQETSPKHSRSVSSGTMGYADSLGSYGLQPSGQGDDLA